MNIKKFTGTITQITNLSQTAKEVTITLSEPIDFIAGSFVNLFMDIKGVKVRRAYSIASQSQDKTSISLAIRLNPGGTMTPLFWNENLLNTAVELMGPLGLNTVDKMMHDKIYLCAFGIGAGVIKSIANYFTTQKTPKILVILTGSKYEEEILYKDYFDSLADQFNHISTLHVVSREADKPGILKGYIQDHIRKFDFNNSDVYVCGQESACNDLVSKINLQNPVDCNFLIEGFHS